MRMRLCVLAVLLAAVPLAASEIAVAAPHHNHGLTIRVAPNPIIAGDGVIIWGQLKGAGAAGQSIRLYHRVNPSRRFSLVGTAVTDSRGYYEFTREEGVVLTNRSWFVRGPGATHSRTIAERVAALVSITSSTQDADTLHPVTFAGQVTPAHPGQRVLLQALEDGSGNGWSTLATARLDQQSRYELSHRWRIAGVRDLRVVLPSDRRNARGESDPVTIVVEQAQVPGFTLKTSAPVLSYGQAATLSGVLDARGTSKPQAGVSVTLWTQPAGARRFAPVSATQTAADGSYSFVVSPPRNALYYVRATLQPKVHSASLYESVHDVVSLHASDTTSTQGGVVTLSGSVLPDKHGEWVYLQRLGRDGAWHSVLAEHLDRQSRFAFNWRFGSTGMKQFRARIFGDGVNAGGASAPVSVNVEGSAPASSLPPGS